MNKIIDLVESLLPNDLLKIGKHPKLGWMDIIERGEFFLLNEAHRL
jgi:hypothetical protein